MGDWSWLEGEWRVRHRKLRARFSGCEQWDEFDGTCASRLVLGGAGNVDDNWIGEPGGAYRALALRAFDAASGDWSIWWLDERFPTTLGVPVKGRFEGGVGRFAAEDRWGGKPILVRFVWSGITPSAARWEQSFSPDRGASWESNWVMDFARG